MYNNKSSSFVWKNTYIRGTTKIMYNMKVLSLFNVQHFFDKVPVTFSAFP